MNKNIEIFLKKFEGKTPLDIGEYIVKKAQSKYTLIS